MNLVYITEKNGSAIKSQVFELLNELAVNKKVEKIFLLLGSKDINEIVDFSFNKKIQIHFFKNFGMYPIVDYLNILELQKVLRNLTLDKDTIFHVRSEYISFLFYKAFKRIHKKEEPKLYIDIRGAVKEEIEMSQLGKLKKLVKLFHFENINNYILNKNFNCNVVSTQLKEYIIKKYKLKKVSVVPCIAGSNFIFDENTRNETRRRLNLVDDEILLIFSSGASNSWQNNDEVVELFSQEYKLLMLTKKKYSNNNVISKFVDFKDVPKYLNAADIGIILRDESIVNRVASPIKFSEYVACGLPVLTDGNVKQINEFIDKYESGYIFSSLDGIENKINLLRNKNRNMISNNGIGTYGIKNIALKYLDEYIDLEGKK